MPAKRKVTVPTPEPEAPKVAPTATRALPSATQVLDAFGRAGPLKRTLMVAGGVLVVGTSPYWVPAAWRSKRVRQVLAVGVGKSFTKWLV